jgi:hypothetical protein
MPVGLDHDSDNVFDIGIGNFRLEEITHAIDENSARTAPQERL